MVLGGERGLYSRLTVGQNLRYWGALFNQSPATAGRAADRLIERFGLSGVRDARVETLSRGSKQRVHLARGLIGDPSLIFLDEPTSGMDPVAAREFREIVRDLMNEGRTVLMATHDMVEAEDLCQRVTLIDQGRLLATESPAVLSQWLSKYAHIDVDGIDVAASKDLLALPGVSDIVARPEGGVRINTETPQATRGLLERLVALDLTEVRVGRPSLDDVYVRLIGDRGLELTW
jgi:ABC-2 type transport system ATP-binding protein